MSGETLLALFGGLGGLITVLVTSLRKRQDDTTEELRRRIARLEDDLKQTERERDAADARADERQADLLIAERHLFATRRLLAQHGVDDPTQP